MTKNRFETGRLWKDRDHEYRIYHDPGVCEKCDALYDLTVMGAR